MNFTQNMGDRDRTIRLVAGVVLTFWGIIAHKGIALIGILLLATVYFRVCPVYALLGMSTRSSAEGNAGAGSEPEKKQVEEQGGGGPI